MVSRTSDSSVRVIAETIRLSHNCHSPFAAYYLLRPNPFTVTNIVKHTGTMKALLAAVAFFMHLLSIGQPVGITNVGLSDAEIRKLLIGTWGGDRNDRHARQTFATNGTCISTNWVTGGAVKNFVSYAESTWRVQDGVLLTTITKTTDQRLCPLGSVWRTRFLLINETGMVGLTQFGTTNTVARIK